MHVLKLHINNPLLPVTLSAIVFLLSCRDKAVPTPLINISPSDTSHVEWIDKKREFNQFLDLIKFGQDTIEAVVIMKLNFIRNRFAGDTHPDLPRLLKNAEGFGFRYNNYETIEEMATCCKNELLPITRRSQCFSRWVHTVVQQEQFDKAIQLDATWRPVFDSIMAISWYQISIDSLKRYVTIRDSLNRLPLPPDSLLYRQAHALRTVVMTTFFCHEGCGGCNHRLTTDKLQSLLKLYPQSALADNAAFELIKYQYQYQYDDGREEEVRIEEKKALTRFMKKYAGSDAAGLAENHLKEIEEILALYQQE